MVYSGRKGPVARPDTFVYAFKYGIKQNSISVYALFDEFMARQQEKRLSASSRYLCNFCTSVTLGKKMSDTNRPH